MTPEEVEDVLYDPDAEELTSRTSHRPAKRGWTSTGKFLFVVFEIASEDPRFVDPLTAFEIPEP